MLTRTTLKSPKLRALSSATTLSALLLVGCAADQGDGELGEIAQAVMCDNGSEPEPVEGETPPVPDPNGAYITEVRANGTGCPAGTWSVEVDDQGKYSLQLDEFAAQLSPSPAQATRDCTLSFKVRAPAGTQYAISELKNTVQVDLEEGVSAFRSADFYFQGSPDGQGELSSEFVGPRKGSVDSETKYSPEEALWSPCGLQRDLNMTIRLGVRSTTPGRSGSIRLEEAPQLKLQVRSCASGGEPAEPSEEKPSDVNMPEAGGPVASGDGREVDGKDDAKHDWKDARQRCRRIGRHFSCRR